MTTWQPLETIPKDTWILIEQSDLTQAVVKWKEELRWRETRIGMACYVKTWEDHGNFEDRNGFLYYPVCWMPLPLSHTAVEASIVDCRV